MEPRRSLAEAYLICLHVPAENQINSRFHLRFIGDALRSLVLSGLLFRYTYTAELPALQQFISII